MDIKDNNSNPEQSLSHKCDRYKMNQRDEVIT